MCVDVDLVGSRERLPAEGGAAPAEGGPVPAAAVDGEEGVAECDDGGG